MATIISREEAVAALAASTEPGDSNSYYVTSEGGYDASDDTTIYMVGYAAADPEESDPEGDPTAFGRTEDGAVIIMGPSF